MVGWMGGGKHRVRGGIHVVEGRVCVCVCVCVSGSHPADCLGYRTQSSSSFETTLTLNLQPNAVEPSTCIYMHT